MSQATRLNPEYSQDKCVGFNVSAPISEILKIERAAKKSGISRSEWIRRAAKHYSSYLETVKS